MSQPKRVTSTRQSALQTLWSATITVPVTKVIRSVTHGSPLLLAKSVGQAWLEAYDTFA
jgi:hypothetical protein